MQRWKDIWRERRLPAGDGPLLERLLAANGYDSGFGAVRPQAWRRYVAEVAACLGLELGASMFDVGCGAGAFLWPLAEAGHPVGGLDLAPGLIRAASEIMPSGRWIVGDAASLDPSERWDVVVASGLFLYLDDPRHAAVVLERMVEKARHAVAVLDVLDAGRAAAAVEVRRQTLGRAEYKRRYFNLDHLAFERRWFEAPLTAAGFTHLEVVDQFLDGYGNAPFRFNVFAQRPFRPRRQVPAGPLHPLTGRSVS